MVNVEKEIRIKVSDNNIVSIMKNSNPYKESTRLIDITCGKYGFKSLEKVGYICRIRCKDDSYKIEIKNYQDAFDCLEKSIPISSIKDGLEFLKLLGLKPYLILDRVREVRKYNNLLIYIDKFDLIGNYVEIEYQESSYEEAIKYLDKLNIEFIPEPKYGDIIANMITKDDKLKIELENSLLKYIEN